jgi:hypothetical protein
MPDNLDSTVAQRIAAGETEGQARDLEPLNCPHCGETFSNRIKHYYWLHPFENAVCFLWMIEFYSDCVDNRIKDHNALCRSVLLARQMQGLVERMEQYKQKCFACDGQGFTVESRIEQELDYQEDGFARGSHAVEVPVQVPCQFCETTGEVYILPSNLITQAKKEM